MSQSLAIDCREEATPRQTGDKESPRRVLFVSYQFPPVGGAGVQRPVKFIKYLARYGWKASVLTVANPSVPVQDPSLWRDLPAATRVVRARTLEPGYAFKQQLSASASPSITPRGFAQRTFGLVKPLLRAGAQALLQPDPQVLWLPAAYHAGLKLLRTVPHAAIVATAPPYTSLLLGGLLRRKTGLPLILDYRDEWDLSSRYLENAHRSRWSQFVQERMQNWVLRQAQGVVATTEASRRELHLRITRSGSRAKTQCIYNGFDRDDFAVPPSVFAKERCASQRWRIVYSGTLWNLTSIAPLVTALQQLHSTAPELAEQVELVVVGRKTAEQQHWLSRLAETKVVLQDIAYCEHAHALELVRSADAVCLLLSDVPGAERVVSAKMFEYFASGRPLLAITPQGETAEIVGRFPHYQHYVPGDIAGITRWIAERVRAFQQGLGSRTETEAEGMEAFSREHLAGELAGLLESLTEQESVRGVSS